MVRKGDAYTSDFKPATLTVAVVPILHTTFYAQPQLVGEKVNK
jgi:hypothetical protein